jgi:peroxin-7
MPRFKTTFNGYAVRFNPFIEGRLAVATAQNFGIIGNGRLHVLQQPPPGAPPHSPLVEVAAFDTADGLYDVAWSEENGAVLAAACGDGSVKVYDLAAPPGANPLRAYREHRHECCSVSWNVQRRDLFASSSWDDTLKVWSLASPRSLQTFAGHTYCVYACAWSPHHGDVLLSASGDTTLRVWDLRQPRPTLVVPAHAHEVLAADWCKYSDVVVATGSVDRSARLWDLRQPGRPLAELPGHAYAVRRVQFSPHSDALLATCSYDMTVRLWDWRTAAEGGAAGGPLPLPGLAPRPPQPPAADPMLRVWDHHTEFAVGLDWSVLSEGVIASCAWDELVAVWQITGAP